VKARSDKPEQIHTTNTTINMQKDISTIKWH